MSTSAVPNAARELRREYEARSGALGELAKKIEETLGQALRDVPHIDRISVRVKGTPSFTKKVLERVGEKDAYVDPFREVEDQVAARIIVYFLRDIPVVVGKIKDWLRPVEMVVKRPKNLREFDYETTHLVLGIPQALLPEGELPRNFVSHFEVQVRTIMQHAYAEPQHDLGYKGESPLADEDVRRLAWIAASCWGADQVYNELAGKAR
ncbi:MAG: RelA/SpoT domain-containing protein [Candidatus Thermoplasmatota archaeon]